MYFPTILVSIISLFLITSSSFFLINNSSKIKLVKNDMKNNVQNISKNKITNDRQLKNLVDQVNKNDKNLDTAVTSAKKNMRKVENESKSRTENMNNRLKSFKNITSANFMGMNNRMTKEHQIINEKHELLKEKQREDMRQANTDISNTNVRLDTQINRYKTYTSNNDYNIKNINNKNAQQDLIAENNKTFLISKMQTDLFNQADSLDTDSKKYVAQLSNAVVAKYDDLDGRFNTFRTSNVPSEYVHTDGNNLNDALTARYFSGIFQTENKNDGLEENIQMKNMVDLINQTEYNRLDIEWNSNQIYGPNKLWDRLIDVEIVSASNYIDKLNIADLENQFKTTDHYDKIMTNYNTINSNLTEINKLNTALDGIQNQSFTKFNNLISENTSNMKLFASSNLTYMNSKFTENSNAISKGLQPSSLKAKLKDMKDTTLELNNVKVTGNLFVDVWDKDVGKNIPISIPDAWKTQQEQFKNLKHGFERFLNVDDSGYMSSDGIVNIGQNNTGTNFNGNTNFKGTHNFEGDATFNNSATFNNKMIFNKDVVVDFDKISDGNKTLTEFVQDNKLAPTEIEKRIEGRILKEVNLTLPKIDDIPINEYIVNLNEQVPSYKKTQTGLKDLLSDVYGSPGETAYNDAFDKHFGTKNISGLQGYDTLHDRIHETHEKVEGLDTNINNIDVGVSDISISSTDNKHKLTITNSNPKKNKDLNIDFPQLTKTSVINALKDESTQIYLDSHLNMTGNVNATGDITATGNITLEGVNSGIKLGGRCLKINGEHLQICPDCNSTTNCTTVWDHTNAPEPNKDKGTTS